MDRGNQLMFCSLTHTLPYLRHAHKAFFALHSVLHNMWWVSWINSYSPWLHVTMRCAMMGGSCTSRHRLVLSTNGMDASIDHHHVPLQQERTKSAFSVHGDGCETKGLLEEE